jgi:hypothetical protein
MEDQDSIKLSCTWLFLITAFCFLMFGSILKILDGYVPGFVKWTCIISFVLGIGSFLLDQINAPSRNKELSS